MPAGVHHIAFRTEDVASLAAFYEEVLGLGRLRSQLPRACWLDLGGGAVLMIEKRAPGEPGPRAGSLDLLALSVDAATLAAVRDQARRLACGDGETGLTVYLRDPDGRRVGVSVYDFTGKFQ